MDIALHCGQDYLPFGQILPASARYLLFDQIKTGTGSICRIDQLWEKYLLLFILLSHNIQRRDQSLIDHIQFRHGFETSLCQICHFLFQALHYCCLYCHFHRSGGRYCFIRSGIRKPFNIVPAVSILSGQRPIGKDHIHDLFLVWIDDRKI